MGKFNFIATELPRVVVIEPTVFPDPRGYFMETYARRDFAQGGIDREFVQDNQSKSTRGVLRGLHFQKQHPQGKLVRVISGEVFEVAVDCRPAARPTADGPASPSRLKTKKCSISPRALPTVFWCCPTRRSSPINAPLLHPGRRGRHPLERP